MIAMSCVKRPSYRAVGEVLDQLFRIVGYVHHELAAVSAEHGLTVQQAILLRSLDDPIPMRVLADELSCDPSTVTGLVDRIERLGLIERLPDQTDRRVRLLTLTPEGRRVRNEISTHLATRTATRWNLDSNDFERLHDLLTGIGEEHSDG